MCGLFHMVGSMVQLAFIVFLGLGAIWFMRRMPPRRRRGPDPLARSMAVLNERYARGAIDRDEYLERRAYLE